MRKLPAAAQEERRWQVVGLRQHGLTYREVAEQVGLSRTGAFDICQRFAAEGAKGLASKPRGRKANEQRLLDAAMFRPSTRIPAHRYGTALVDLERDDVVDLLPDRQAESLVAFLKAHAPGG